MARQFLLIVLKKIPMIAIGNLVQHRRKMVGKDILTLIDHLVMHGSQLEQSHGTYRTRLGKEHPKVGSLR